MVYSEVVGLDLNHIVSLIYHESLSFISIIFYETSNFEKIKGLKVKKNHLRGNIFHSNFLTVA